MSKRNFILLIIISSLTVIIIFGILYFRPLGTTPSSDNGGGTNFISQFNPSGNSKGTGEKSKPEPTTPEATPESTPAPTLKLNKVSSMPIAGFAVFKKERLKDVPVVLPTAPTTENGVTNNTTKKTTSTKKPTPPPTEIVPALRYVDRATGNIYQTFVDKIEERKFSGTMVPKVYEAYFGNNGESVVMQNLKADEKTIETFVGTLPKELLGADTTGNNEIKGSFLPDNVKDLSLSPDSSKMFYLFINGGSSGDSMVGTILNFSNNKKTQIFDSPFTEWLSFWGSNNLITLTTKPSANVPGYMYKIDSAGKNLSEVLGNINGLTTLASPNGKLILYGDGNLSLNIYHLDTRNSDPLSIKTLPEKCVWGSASDTIYCAVPKSITGINYPDTWYQGEVSFLDQLWKIDVKTGNATMILDPVTVTGGEEVDGIKLALDDGENYLFFINKKDSFLWEINLK